MKKLSTLAHPSNLGLQLFRGTIKRLSVALITLVMTLTAQTAWAEDPSWLKSGDSWDDATKTLTVNSVTVPKSAYENCSEIEHIVISNNVTSIGGRAFADCYSLNTITIPASVTSIGGRAFADCYSLNTITIPASVTSIGSRAFNYCTNLASVSGCEGVTSVGSSAFANTAWLDAQPNGVVYIGKVAYLGKNVSGEISINAGTVAIADEAFQGRTGLTSVTIPVSVTRIGQFAFDSCTNLASVSGCEGVTKVGNYAFSDTAWLDAQPDGVIYIDKVAYFGKNVSGEISINEGTLTISDKAFEDCTSLTSVTIPSSVTSIGECAFWGCSDLASVTVYALSCSLGRDAFFKCAEGLQIYVYSDLIGTYQGAWSDYEGKITSMTNSTGNCGADGHVSDVTWELSLTSTTGFLTISGTGNMADFASANGQPWSYFRSSITSVVVENGVTSIGANAFKGCKLSSITLPEGLTTINAAAFADNGTTIASVSIPQSVTSIGDHAFDGTSVTHFYINNIPSKIAISANTPFVASGTTFHVFTQMQDVFTNATNWSNYAGHFLADVDITHVASVTLDNESMIVKTLASGRLNATINPADARVKDVVFTSSNSNIINITDAATGEFQAGSQEGTATITCTAIDGSGEYATCVVRVDKNLTPAESVTLNKSEKSMIVGETFKLTATVNPGNAMYKNVTWRSSDENVATVNSGTVTAVAAGVATITAISGDGNARANCVVTVKAPITTSYVDANGTLHENVTAMPLDNSMTTLAAGWYVVNEDVTYTSMITLDGNVNLILGDGKTMTVTNTGTDVNDRAIYGNEKTLHIYGQSLGTGALTATAVGGESAILLEIKHDNVSSLLGIHGGVVSASTEYASGSGIVVQCATDAGGIVIDGGQVTASGKSYGIFCYSGHFDVIGGQVTATGTNGYGLGICDYGTNPGVLTLGYSKATDFVSTNSINNFSGDSEAGEVKIATGQTLVDGNGNIWSGTLSNSDIQSIQNQTLRPVTGVALAKDGSGNISATFNGTSLETVNIPVGVTVNSVTLNRTFTPGKASTVMLPFDYTCTGNEGGTFYKFVSMEKENEQWVATMKATGDDTNNVGTLTKNTPYLFLPTATGITFSIPNEGVTLCSEGGGNCQTADAGSHWTFKGTNSYIKWTSNTADADYTQERADEIGKVYGFAGVQKDGIDVGDFVKAKSGAKIRPMTCYLIWNSTPNNTRGMTRSTDDELPSSIVVRLLSSVGPGNQGNDDNQGNDNGNQGGDDNGETTAIGTLDTETGEIDFGDWYDMSGRKLSVKPTQKGLYIHNGKKVIIK